MKSILCVLSENLKRRKKFHTRCVEIQYVHTLLHVQNYLKKYCMKEWRQKVQDFMVIFDYIVSLSSIWAIWDSVKKYIWSVYKYTSWLALSRLIFCFCDKKYSDKIKLKKNGVVWFTILGYSSGSGGLKWLVTECLQSEENSCGCMHVSICLSFPTLI